MYGIRNEATGYAAALARFDKRLPQIIEQLKEKDLLIITADHGCDPTVAGTDHTRENVPLLVYGPDFRSGVDLGLRQTFADAGATIAQHLGISSYDLAGASFYQDLRRK